MKANDILKSKLILIPLFLASVVASVYLLQIVFVFLSQFSWLFIILIYAYIIYVLISPLDRILQKGDIPSNISLILSFLIVFTFLTLALLFINPILTDEVQALANQLKTLDLNNTIDTFIGNIANLFHIDASQLRTGLINSIQNLGGNITTNLLGTLSNALITFAQIILALIFGYFFIKDGQTWFKNFLKLIPKDYREETKIILGYFNKNATSFLRVQIAMAFIYAIINYIVMSILGVNFALTASLIAFITFIIPGIGPIISMIVPVTVTLLFNSSALIWLIAILLIVQQIVLNIIIPRMYGNKVGVHPLIVLLSILVGVQLFGVLGAFIVIPIVAVIINVINTYLFHRQSAI